MAGILPLELLIAIGSYLDEGGTPLASYTTVCRRWQAAFEPFIYSKKLVIHSDNGGTEAPSSAISVDKFQALTSGAGATRRTWIRQLQNIISVPYELPDWTSRKHKGYRLQNPVRKANNEAFRSATFRLFQVLRTWDQNNRVSLEFGLMGRQLGEEPFTSYYPDAWEYTWDFTNGRTKATKPYRACFPDNNASMLPYVACIDKLHFVDLWDPDNGQRNHQIWAKAIFQIVQHCPTIVELHVDLDYQTRPDQLEYLQARRQALTLDFLCPIDDFGQPTLADLHWPHLETIELNDVPRWLPSGTICIHKILTADRN
ncbi:F-box protein [Aspergillus neoniger CBS 115656]|uniref:Uncharacterized protein n=1 Tax=Aspergillus neoniger (strain CBS 115656) TaxID=1448310 RepID=A0A318YTE3_ASPNB|nr:hypothetical protein BO87DRAFT_351648 [Aspergillus neoniger CBS 115656]PYH37719.1 hypothetical protein BO87DRAFT_351648 [Aspergillus neoniger CBS 115656]